MINESDKYFENCNLITIRVLFFVLVSIKGIDRLVYPAIWAEDGRVFLKQAFEIGWSSLLKPYDGYFHTIPRLIALISACFPIEAIPVIIVLLCYGIFTYTITLPFTKPYKWLFCNQVFSLAIAIVLLVSPGQATMLGNGTNLHWYLLLLLSILGLKDIRMPYSFGEIVIAFLCVSSEGAVIILLPLFLTRYIMKKTQRVSSSYGDLLIVIFILLFTFVNLLQPQKADFTFTFSVYYDVLISQFLNFFILHIFVGDYQVMSLQGNRFLLFIFATMGIFLMLYLLKKNWRKEYLLVIVLSFCSLILPVMIIMARPGSTEIFNDYFDYNFYSWFRFRYSFFVPAIAGIFWISLLANTREPKFFKNILLAVILFVQVFFNTYRIPIYRYENYNNDWFTKAHDLSNSLATGTPKEVRINIHPAGWFVTIQPSKKSRFSEMSRESN